jgi:hypothetical protein
MDELPMHLYILIWSISEMDQRFKISPADPEFGKICYPFTKVPLFNKKEGENLADLWRKNIEPNKGLFAAVPEPRKKAQKGGKIPTLSEMKQKSAQFGQAINFAVKALDPKLISPDYLFDYTTELFDNIDSGLHEASSTFGLIALESTTPDPTLIIPTIPPVPVVVPSRTVLPVINAILESIRIWLGFVGMIDPLGLTVIPRCLITLIMVLMDIGRGNLYHAIFTSFGLIGSFPMFIGIGLKIVRDGLMLVSPDLRTELRYLLFKSSKSMVLGFAIWLFTTLSPQFVKAPLRALFDSVAVTIDNMNQQLELAEVQANLSPAGVLATIKLPRIPGDKIPDVDNLYALREAIREPMIYCDPKIADLMSELRGVPPYALFFDLALIPAPGTPQFIAMCAPFKGRTMSDNLTAAAEPQIIPKQLALPPGALGGLAAVQSIASNPQGAALGALASSSPLGALAAQAATDPKAAALGALASSSPLGALAAQAATDPKGAALGALASSSPLGALAAQAATDPKAAALGALASSSPLGALAAQAATDPKAAALGALASSSPAAASALKVATNPTAALAAHIGTKV